MLLLSGESAIRRVPDPKTVLIALLLAGAVFCIGFFALRVGTDAGLRAAGLSDVTAQGKFVRLAPVEAADSVQIRLKRLYPGTILKPAVRSALIPLPRGAVLGSGALTDAALLEWLTGLLGAMRSPAPAPSA